MKRSLIFFLVLALVIAILSGCSKGDSADDISIEHRQICDFIKICDTDYRFGNNSSFWCDKTNGVIYLMISGTYVNSFTPVFNADGTLKIWDRYKEG